MQNSFSVQAPPEAAWELLLDVPRVVPCMPGAQLIEVVDESTWKARMDVKLGPVALVFDTDITREGIDESGRRIVLAARARERRGRGGAHATVDSSLSTVDGTTRVEIVTDLSLSGSVAQYGRGMVQDISSQLVGRFAESLQAQLAARPADASARAATRARPSGGGPASAWSRRCWTGAGATARRRPRMTGRGRTRAGVGERRSRASLKERGRRRASSRICSARGAPLARWLRSGSKTGGRWSRRGCPRQLAGNPFPCRNPGNRPLYPRF